MCAWQMHQLIYKCKHKLRHAVNKYSIFNILILHRKKLCKCNVKMTRNILLFRILALLLHHYVQSEANCQVIGSFLSWT